MHDVSIYDNSISNILKYDNFELFELSIECFFNATVVIVPSA